MTLLWNWPFFDIIFVILADIIFFSLCLVLSDHHCNWITHLFLIIIPSRLLYLSLFLFLILEALRPFSPSPYLSTTIAPQTSLTVIVQHQQWLSQSHHNHIRCNSLDLLSHSLSATLHFTTHSLPFHL